jgi:cephalosporin-C deacetylase-like acetyl esterase
MPLIDMQLPSELKYKAQPTPADMDEYWDKAVLRCAPAKPIRTGDTRAELSLSPNAYLYFNGCGRRARAAKLLAPEERTATARRCRHNSWL